MRPTLLTTQDRRAFRATSGLILTPDTRWLIAWSDHGARIFDAAQVGAPLWSSEHVVRRLSASSHLVAYITHDPHRLVIIDVTTAPTTRAEVALSAAPRAVAVAGERVVVVGADGALRLFEVDVAGRVAERVLEGATFEGQALGASEDGRWVAAVSTLRAGRATQVCWIEVEALRVAQVVKHTRGGITALRFTPDAQRLVAAAGGEVCVWTKPKITARALLKGMNLPELLDLTDTGRLVVLDPGAAVICVDVTSGQEQWRQPAARVAAAAGDEVVVYEAGRLLRRDARTGALQGACEALGAPRALAVDAERGVAHVITSASPLIRTWPLAGDALEAAQASGEVGCAASSGRWIVLGGVDGGVAALYVDERGATQRWVAPPRAAEVVPCRWIHVDEAADRVWAAVGASVVSWRLSTGEELARSAQRSAWLWATLIAPARGLIVAVTLSKNKGYGELVVWSAESLDVVHAQALKYAVGALAMQADGAEVWLCDTQRPARFELATYTIIDDLAVASYDEAPMKITAHYGFDHAAKMKLHWLERAVSGVLVGDKIPCTPVACRPVWVGADWARCATLHLDRALCVWDVASGASLASAQTAIGAPAQLLALPGRAALIACGADGSAQLWELE